MQAALGSQQVLSFRFVNYLKTKADYVCSLGNAAAGIFAVDSKIAAPPGMTQSLRPPGFRFASARVV